jgi:tetratricopeptide (TPR) repeat protein
VAEGEEQNPSTRVARQREEAARRLDEWRHELATSVRDLDDRAARVGGPTAADADDRARAVSDDADTDEIPAVSPPGRPAAALRAIPVWALATLAVAGAYVWLALLAGGVEPSSFAAATVVVWWSVLVAALVGAWPGGRLPPAAAIVAVLLAALVALALGSTEWASDNGRAYAEGIRALGYLGLFALTVLVVRNGGARVLLGGIAIGMVAVAVLALLSRVQPWTTGIETELENALPGSRGRLSYPIGYWNGLAACMALAICLLAWLGAGARARPARALAVAAIPLPALVISLTASRGGLIAAAFGVCGLIAFSPHRWRIVAVTLLGIAGAVPLIAVAHAEPDLVQGIDTPSAGSAGDRVSLLCLAVGLVLAALVYRGDRFLATLHPSRFRLPPRTTAVAVVVLLILAVLAVDPGQRLRETRSAAAVEAQTEPLGDEVAAGQVSGRTEYWDAALEAFRSEPLVGIGAGGFESWWLQNGELSQAVSNAHSLYVESLAELGVAGFACVIGTLGLALITGARRAILARRRGDLAEAGVLAAALAVLLSGSLAAAVEWTWEIPAAFAPVIVAIAVLTTPPFVTGPGGVPSRRRRLATRSLAVLASIAAIAAAGALFLAEQRLQDAESSLADGDPDAAADDARAASDLSPWAAAPYTQLAFAETERGRLDEAREAVSEAIERAPEDFSLYLIAARIYYRDGDADAGELAIDRARELAPRVPESLLRVPGARTRAEP